MSPTDYRALKYEWLNRIARYVQYIPIKSMIVVRVEKAGQTSLCRDIVGRRCKHQVLNQSSDPRRFEHGLFGSAPVTDKLESWAVVRNPWDRLVGNWAHMSENARTDSSFKDFVVNREWEDYSFDSWIQFKPCSWFTHQDGEQMVEHILPFEDFENSARVIAEKLDVKLDEVPHHNKTDRKPYQEYYSDSLVNLVGELYREDVENFGYEF